MVRASSMNLEPRPSMGTPASPVLSRRSLRLLVGALLAAMTLFFAAAQNASAITFGMMSGDTLSWQEASGWNGIQHSGAKIFRAQIRGSDYSNPAIRAKIEKMFRMAAERDITILPYLYGRPGSGSRQFPSESEWKASEGEWTSFVNGVVQRFGYNGSFWTEAGHPTNYKPVTAWEVWNEPNLKLNNPGGAAIYPESYAKFLNFMSAKIKAAQAAIAPGFGIEVLPSTGCRCTRTPSRVALPASKHTLKTLVRNSTQASAPLSHCGSPSWGGISIPGAMKSIKKPGSGKTPRPAANGAAGRAWAAAEPKAQWAVVAATRRVGRGAARGGLRPAADLPRPR